MDYMLVKQKVHDLGRFQKAFDEMKEHREKAGLKDLGQFCDSEDPNVVIVVMEAADIIGPLEAGTNQVWLTDGLVRDRI